MTATEHQPKTGRPVQEAGSAVGDRGTMTVAQVMTSKVTTAELTDTVGRVRGQLIHLPIGLLPVVDGDRLVGTVSLEDLSEAAYDTEPIERHVCSPPLTIGPGERVAELVSRLRERRAHHMIVVDEGAIVGIVSTFDLLDLLT